MENSNKKGIGAFQIAFILVGTIVGAGFASGREIWTYFGAFGKNGYAGLVIFAFGYLVITFASSLISTKISTSDFEKIITPSGCKTLEKAVAGYMSFVLWGVMITMTSAGGSVLASQFGFNKFVGGLIVVVCVLVTIFGDFQRVSKAFTFVMPIMIIAMIITCITCLTTDFVDPGYNDVPLHSVLTPTWYISGIVYVCFTIGGTICMAAKCTMEAKNNKAVYTGIGIAAFLVLLFAVLMTIIENFYPSFSEAMDMPMLGYASLCSPIIELMYSVVMLFCIYASATSNFYNATTKIKESKYRKLIITALALLAYSIGLVGFKNIVNYLFSVVGIVGIFVLTIFFIHLVQELKNENN